MHEPITLVRRRDKNGKPGNWEILIGPERPLMDHLDANKKIVACFPQHEEFAAVRVARLEDVTRPIAFKTKTEIEAEAETAKRFAARQAQTGDDAKKRQQKLDAERQKADDELKATKLAEMNKMHDEIRNPKPK